MKILQGFRTIIFNSAALLTAWLADFNIELPEDNKTAIGITIIAVINIILRLITKTPVGTKEEATIKTKVVKNS